MLVTVVSYIGYPSVTLMITLFRKTDELTIWRFEYRWATSLWWFDPAESPWVDIGIVQLLKASEVTWSNESSIKQLSVINSVVVDVLIAAARLTFQPEESFPTVICAD
jgi:hypothetical protein